MKERKVLQCNELLKLSDLIIDDNNLEGVIGSCEIGGSGEISKSPGPKGWGGTVTGSISCLIKQ